MCVEHQCPCCSEDLPVDTCKCIKCWHDNKTRGGDTLEPSKSEESAEDETCCDQPQKASCDEVQTNGILNGDLSQEVGGPCCHLTEVY